MALALASSERSRRAGKRAARRRCTPSSSGCFSSIPTEVLSSSTPFLDVASYAAAALVAKEWSDAFQLCDEAFWNERALARFPIIGAMEDGALPPPVNYKALYKRHLEMDIGRDDEVVCRGNPLYSTVNDIGDGFGGIAPSFLQDGEPTTTMDDYHFAVELVLQGESVWVTEAFGSGHQVDEIETVTMPTAIRKLFFDGSGDGGLAGDNEDGGGNYEYEYDDSHTFAEYGKQHSLGTSESVSLRCVITERRTGKQALFYRGGVDYTDEEHVYMEYVALRTRSVNDANVEEFSYSVKCGCHLRIYSPAENSHVIMFPTGMGFFDEFSHRQLLLLIENHICFK